MRRMVAGILICLFTAGLFLLMWSGAATRASAASDGLGNVRHIYTGLNGSCPRMDVAPDGTLMLVYNSGRQLHVVFSTNGGLTWSGHVVAVDYKGTKYSPANCAFFVDDETGLVYLCFRAPIENEDGTYTANINYVTSSDNGRTWSAPINVATATVTSNEEGGGMWEPTIYRTDGRIRIYYCSTEVKQGDGQVYVNGGTKFERHDDTFPYVISRSVQNIVMHELDEETGEWSGAVCTQDGYSHIPYEIDEEKGYHGRDGMQSIGQLPDGSYVMVVESSKYNLASRYGMTRYPMVVDISFSLDGVHYSDPRTIVFPRKSPYLCGAPWVAVLPDGRIAVCYQSNNYVSDATKEKYESNRQVELIVSKECLSYADRETISPDDFNRYLPLDRANTEVTYNHWNGLYVYDDKLYVLSNHTTNDKNVTPGYGIILSVYNILPIADDEEIPEDTPTETDAPPTEDSTTDTPSTDNTQGSSLTTALLIGGVAVVAIVTAAIIMIHRRKHGA